MYSVNEALMDAVERHDLQGVLHCLDAGADPNYTRFPDAGEQEAVIQPTTPLRMVMFCISDSLLDDAGLRAFYAIAQALLARGADPVPAREIAAARYGPYDREAADSLFMDVWRLVADAH